MRRNLQEGDTLCLELLGGACFLFVGLWVFASVVSLYSVPGITDAPSYTRNWLTMSMSHHFESTSYSPPPPPSF